MEFNTVAPTVASTVTPTPTPTDTPVAISIGTLTRFRDDAIGTINAIKVFKKYAIIYSDFSCIDSLRQFVTLCDKLIESKQVVSSVVADITETVSVSVYPSNTLRYKFYIKCTTHADDTHTYTLQMKMGANIGNPFDSDSSSTAEYDMPLDCKCCMPTLQQNDECKAFIDRFVSKINDQNKKWEEDTNAAKKEREERMNAAKKEREKIINDTNEKFNRKWNNIFTDNTDVFDDSFRTLGAIEYNDRKKAKMAKLKKQLA